MIPYKDTLRKHVELLQTKPGSSFIPATSISVLSLLNIFLPKNWTQANQPFTGSAMRAVGPTSTLALLGISSVFALSSYSIVHDSNNGPSTATGETFCNSDHFYIAWCVAYLAMFGKSTLQSRQIPPILLTGSVLAAGVVYLREMLDLDLDD
jgi:hypothetical protein